MPAGGTAGIALLRKSTAESIMRTMLQRFIPVIAGIAIFGVQAAAGAETYRIGLSNGWVGSEWRTQMIEEAQAAAAAWKKQGVDVELVVQSSDMDVQGQIAAVRNFINGRVQAVIINPNSPTAFDPIFAQAKARGVLVIATDSEVTSKDALYVGIDQRAWAAQSAEWLAKQLNGKGEIVAINGVPGHPANQKRVEGYRAVFAKYPGIKVLNEANANWDQAQGQQTMQTLLATYPKLQGVWVQDGMAAGAWRAITAAGRKDIVATGEIRTDFLANWKKHGYKTGASVNPPGVMASALNVAVWRLKKMEFKDGVLKGPNKAAVYVPIPFIDASNVDKAYEPIKNKPPYYSVTSVVSIDQARALFK
jgi:ribose transport system substrate-binding protein